MRGFFVVLLLLVLGTGYAEKKADNKPISQKAPSKRIKIPCQEWARLTGESTLPCDAIPVLRVTQSQYRAALRESLAKQERQKCKTAVRAKMAAAGKKCPAPGELHTISIWTGPDDPEYKTADCVAELKGCDDKYHAATSPPVKSKPKKQIKLF